VRQTQYGFVYVLTATCAQTGQAEGLIAPRLDTGIVNLFLAQLSQRLEPGVQAVLVWDGVGYHRSSGLICPANITLLQLPPYSPELNPVENLWHYLRSHHWSNRKYDTVEDLLEAAETAWRATCLDPNVIRTVCRAPYAEMRS
jgi:transposase